MNSGDPISGGAGDRMGREGAWVSPENVFGFNPRL
jgi:hypothetical protein